MGKRGLIKVGSLFEVSGEQAQLGVKTTQAFAAEQSKQNRRQIGLGLRHSTDVTRLDEPEISPIYPPQPF